MNEVQMRSLAGTDESMPLTHTPLPQRSFPTPRLYLAARSPRCQPQDIMNPMPAASVAEAPFPLLNEDLAALSPILDTLGLTAAYWRDGEAAPVPLPSNTGIDSPQELNGDVSLNPMISLWHPNGRRQGRLGIVWNQSIQHDSVHRVLHTSLVLASQAISERWFRLEHHKSWIIAAAPIANPGEGMLLALDRRLSVQGMDAQGIRWLGNRGTEARAPRWEDFFDPVTPLPTLRARADVPLRLIGARDGARWAANLTSPDCGVGGHSHDALLHARPRLRFLADLMNSEPYRPFQIPSFTPGMRRKIEEYIEAHLEMPLSVKKLAEAAGMSCSHFTRAFRNVLKMTPHRYVMWRRLLRAQELIRSCNGSLSEIALAAGFADQSHLCRLFQLHVGETPSGFRRRYRYDSSPSCPGGI